MAIDLDVFIDGVPLEIPGDQPQITPGVKSVTLPLGDGAELMMPPGGGNLPVPVIQQFVGIVNSVRKFYQNPDEAVRANRVNARNMWRNLQIRSALQERQLAVAELPYHIEPQNKRDQEQVRIAGELQAIVDEIPDFLKYRKALLNAIWFGRYGCQNQYGWDYARGYKRLIVNDWSPVHGDTLVFKWDSNAVGLLVGMYSGYQGTRDLTTEPTDISRAHVLDSGPQVETLPDGRQIQRLTLHEREALVLHTHDYEAGDFFEPESAGGVKGIGLRSVCYWTWYLQNEITGWLVELLERVGTGLTIVRYQRGNAESYDAAKRIAESNSFQAVLLFPRDPGTENLEDIERVEPSAVGIDNLLKVINDFFGAQLRRYIVGQDSTSQPVATGLGSEIAKVQEGTFMRLVKYDAINLEQTLTRDLLRVIQRWTFPGTAPCKLVLAADKPDPKQFLDAAKIFYDLGGALDEDELRNVIGLTKPDPDAAVLQKKEQPQIPGMGPDGLAGGLEEDPFAEEDDSTDDQDEDVSQFKKRFDWTSYEGPNGGKGWRNSDSGEIVYGGEKPGGDKKTAGDKKPKTGQGRRSQTPKEQQRKAKVAKAKAVLGSIGKKGIEAVAKAGGTVGHAEHVAKEWVKEKVGERVEKLPPKTQSVVKGVWTVLRLGSATLFATYTAGQSLVEEVAKERGATEEQAQRLRGILAAVDVTLAKPAVIAAEVAHLEGGWALGFVPVASASYLAYSTARNPIKTLKGARNAIKKALTRKTPEKSVRPVNRVIDTRGVIPPKGGHTHGPWQKTRSTQGTTVAAMDRTLETLGLLRG